MGPVRVGNRLVGPGQPCLLVAEIGINHNGDLDLALRTVDAAAEAGADAVKFQNYRTEDFLTDRTLTHEYVSRGRKVVESQFDLFKRCELGPGWLGKLKEHCDRRGVLFFSTPTSREGVEELARLGAPLLKNGSDYLTNLPVIAAMARTGLPTVLSTGMATLAEIDEAVRGFRDAGGTQLILLHCTSSYPTPPADVHLRKIPALGAAFDCPVGLSDHTDGVVAAIGAVALGACMVEKHFTLDKDLPGPDHSFSADPPEFRQLATSVRVLHQCLGQSAIGPAASEAAGRRAYRLSCVAGRALPAGHRVAEEDLAFRRPGTGLPPALAPWLIGRPVRAGVPAGHVLQLSDFIHEAGEGREQPERRLTGACGGSLLRPVAPGDSRVIFEMRNDPWIRSLGTDARVITWEEHTAWFKSTQDTSLHLLFIVQDPRERPIGTVRFDREADTAVISVYLLREHTGRGLGPKAIVDGCHRAFAAWPGLRRVLAHIRLDNLPSLRAFTRAGFRPDEGVATPAGCRALALPRDPGA